MTGRRDATDARLIARLRAGDPGAWDAIDAHYRPLLSRFAGRMLGDLGSNHVDDVVQEALWRTHRALLRDDRPVQLRPWLYRLTRNCCLDERARVRVGVSFDEERAIPDDRADPHVLLERRTRLRRLFDDLAVLPDAQRHALIRREIDGVSHQELALELGLTTAATRGLVHRARAGLARAAGGRDAACGDVRDDLLASVDEHRRPTAHTLRHLAGCGACRELRSRLREQRRGLAALAPPAGLLMVLGGHGLIGKASGVKVAAFGTAAVVVAGVSLQTFGPGAPAPLGVRSKAVPGRRLVAGAPVPSGTAIVRRRVALRDGAATASLPCPSGLRVADLLAVDGGRVNARYANRTVVGVSPAARVALRASGAAPPAAATVTVLCKRPDAHGSIVATGARAAAAGATRHVLAATDLHAHASASAPATGSVRPGQPVTTGPTTGAWTSVTTDTAEHGWLPTADLR